MGQKIWVVDIQGGTGASEITTVDALTAGPDTVTVDLANGYAAGAIIGWDPCPLILSGDVNGGTASSKASRIASVSGSVKVACRNITVRSSWLTTP